MIRSKGLPAEIVVVFLFAQDAPLKAHPAYRQAKAGRNPALVPKKNFVQLIKERFDDERTEVFGIEPGALTANETQYLAGFRSVDALRNRLATAEQDIDRRLRSKGIARTSQAASLGAHVDPGLTPPVSGADDEAP